MADQHQLAILKQGVDAWNAWRAQHPAIEPDLSEADLGEAHLTTPVPAAVNFKQANLRGTVLMLANLRRADLSGAELRGSSFQRASLRGATLAGANLSHADLARADLIDADLRGATLTGTNLCEASLLRAELLGSDLTTANLTDAFASQANLSGANLSQTTLIETSLNDANLSGANLSGANLRRANLARANLTQANLTQANLTEVSLIEANLTQANLSGADLSRADLRRANLAGATLEKAIFDGASVGLTQFSNVDLRAVNGLETVVHEAPSSIGLDTLFRSLATFPDSFLRKAGVPENFLSSIHALAAHAVEYSMCFLICASEDQTFAESLYASLQHEGIRCWLAWDDYMVKQRIDEAMRVYDRVLLVLSRDSVDSPAEWVEYAIEAALAKEHREQRVVLFPIRLDSAVLESTASWAVQLRNTRQIEDFTRWQDHDAYAQGLRWLLRGVQFDGFPKTKHESRG